MKVVVSQPMFLPWIGLFEQIRLSDVFVHYDDVQLPQGRSFMSRVQVKTSQGPSWLSAPLDRNRSGDMINQCWLVADRAWREKHLQTLRHCYAKAPFFETMYDLARQVYAFPGDNLAEFNRNAIELVGNWLGLRPRYLLSSQMGIGGRSTQRLVNICTSLQADSYITGLGALKYLEYQEFEANRIAVRYMDYQKRPYPQLHGEFTPYVTILDPIAHCGEKTRDLLCSNSIYWKDYLNESR